MTLKAPERPRLFILCVLLATLLLPADANGMSIGVQDQGADPSALVAAAHDLGTSSTRVIATPADPKTHLIDTYIGLGLRVQGVILVKRQTTVGDVRSVMRAWHGRVRTVSIGNEPELNGISACAYRRLFTRASAMIRHEYPGTTVGFGEFSPVALGYIHALAKCWRGQQVRAGFTAVHPYQFFSDPLSRPTEQPGVGTYPWIGLGSLGTLKRALRAAHLPTRMRGTEFSYLVSGGYRISMAKCTSYWPRAIKQAARWLDQLIVYGIGRVPHGSWGSACLLDGRGQPTPAFLALAKALGRPMPHREFLGEPYFSAGLPGLDVAPAAPPLEVAAPPEDVAVGASVPEQPEEPPVVVDPPIDPPADPPIDLPADPPVEAPSDPAPPVEPPVVPDAP